MSLIIAFGEFILLSYLSFTTGLATLINPAIAEPISNIPTQTSNESSHSDTLGVLPSDYNQTEGLPAILLRDELYQQEASIINAVGEAVPVATTSVAAATVNIICTYSKDTESYRTITGSGVVIDPKGVILTNAHVAQFLLLEEFLEGKSECVVRTGSPATARYYAQLLYISPAWVQQHADLIEAEAPSGTGERDYALLYLTSGVNNQPVPRFVPYLNLSFREQTSANTKDAVVVAGYPAKMLNQAALEKLAFMQATTTIVEFFTFETGKADIFSIGGTPVGENGTSGGPVVTPDGTLIGLVSTRGLDKFEGAGSLRALTIPYINRTMQDETGFTLERNLYGDLSRKANIFNDTLVPFLAQTLEWQLAE